MSKDTLPDSRLCDSRGSVMMDHVLPDGRKVRLEMVPVYCANCGKPRGFVPKEGITWTFWLCTDCSQTHGEVAGCYSDPTEEFWEKVRVELVLRFGRIPTMEEIALAEERGDLGRALELLVKESPIKV